MQRVSVALATFNGGRFLREQLDSLLAQTRLPDELVIGDDNSADATLEIVHEFAGSAPFPVRVQVNAPGLGPAGNFASTIVRCSGDVIFLCDQDDVWLPRKIETMVRALAGRPDCLVAVHDAALIDAAGRRLGRSLGEQLSAAGADPAKGLVAGCCMAFDGRLARLYDPAPRTAFHDAWLTALADRLDARLYIPEQLILYRRHGGNVSHSYMSGASRASRWHRIGERMRRAFARPLGQALEEALDAKRSTLLALERHQEIIGGIFGQARVSQALAGLHADCRRDAARLQIHTAGAIRRPLLLARAVAGGHYRGGQGMLSLMRDVAGALRR